MSTTRGSRRIERELTVNPRQISPVALWAAAGAVLLAFELYVLWRWFTGPYFERVPSGPADPPALTKVLINGLQIFTPALMAWFVYQHIVRPWRSERRVTFEGVFLPALLLSSIYDPLSNYFQTWFTYNGYWINWGHPLSAIPGWQSYGDPGAMVAFPAIFVPPSYAAFFLCAAWVGTRLMRWARRTRPRLSIPALVGICFLAMACFDIICEPILALRAGLWVFGGGVGSFGGDHYYRLPYSELLVASVMFTAVTCFTFFRDDKGYAIVERGADQIPGEARRAIYRFLAVLAGTQLLLLFTYHLPSALVSLEQRGWPREIQERSYLTNHVCGAGTDRACPGRYVPIEKPGSPYLDPSGKLVVPHGARLPTPIPFRP